MQQVRGLSLRRCGGLIAAVAAVAAIACTAPAQAHSPRLSAQVRGIDTLAQQRPLHMTRLDIEVVARGAIAQTTLHARFGNPTQEVLEGRFALELPEGAVVTGYALDVGGVMLDGVLVDQPRARVIYSEKVRAAVDPGIAEVSRDNTFTTNIYPITAAGREIKITFVAPVRFDRGLVLPLVSAAPVGAVRIDVRADDVASAPRVELPAALTVTRSEQSGAYSLTARGNDVGLAGALRVAPVQPIRPLLRAQHASGSRFFQLADSAVAVTATAAERPLRVRIYWDRSASRRTANLAEEAALLREYLQLARPEKIDFVAFNSSGARHAALSSAAALDAVLERMVYRGATSFAVLAAVPQAPADLCLLFSDGVATIDGRDQFAPDCPLIAVTTAPDADRGYLERCAGPGGAVLTLSTATRREVLLELQQLRARILDVRDTRGERLDFAVLADTSEGWHIVGAAPLEGQVTVRFALPGGRTLVRRYAADGVTPRFDGAGALWAARAAALLAASDTSRAQLQQLSRAYSIASPAMSFLVLEDPSDYVYSEVQPPATLPAEMMVRYLEVKARYAAEQEQARAEHARSVVADWQEQQAWWRAPPPKPLPTPSAAPRPTPPAASRPSVVIPSNTAPDGSGEEQVLVTGSYIRGSSEDAALPIDVLTAEDLEKSGSPSTVDLLRNLSLSSGLGAANVARDREVSAPLAATDIGIELARWQPDRPYLRALMEAPAQFERVFAEQEREHGAFPAFYLDVAEWLQRQRQSAASLEVLLSALELPRSEAVLLTVADRLQRYGELDRAIWIYESLCESTPERPQPLRGLALALAQRADRSPAAHAREDLVRAVQLLNQVALTSWQSNFDGIDMIAVMEANALIPKLRRLGVQRFELDPRLQGLLSVDLRIVIEWNSPATDIDLWVEEPSGERAFYGHPDTISGGRMSNDMTFGYGPEQYLLRRAAPGHYQVKVNVFATDQINPNGVTTVTARLIRNFGRRSQREERIDLELLPGQDGAVLLGEFVVAP